jgi:hypothetical protein
MKEPWVLRWAVRRYGYCGENQLCTVYAGEKPVTTNQEDGRCTNGKKLWRKREGQTGRRNPGFKYGNH